MQCHKRSLKLNEDHVKRIRAYRDEFWNENIVVFKNPQFDFTAAPRIVFAGEAGVDAGGLGREYGILLRNAIFSAKANLFEGPEDRKVPLYSIDAINSRLFQLAGKMVSYLIVHLDIGIPTTHTLVVVFDKYRNHQMVEQCAGKFLRLQNC